MRSLIINRLPAEVKIIPNDSCTGNPIMSFQRPTEQDISSFCMHFVSDEEMEDINGVPTIKRNVVPPELPKPEKGVYYIVRHVIKSLFPEREDFLLVINKNKDPYGPVIADGFII